jgi:hypothetical protein
MRGTPFGRSISSSCRAAKELGARRLDLGGSLETQCGFALRGRRGRRICKRNRYLPPHGRSRSQIGTIPLGVASPYGIYVDKRERLYVVTSYAGVKVYAPRSGSVAPIATYSQRLNTALYSIVDGNGDLFVSIADHAESGAVIQTATKRTAWISINTAICTSPIAMKMATPASKSSHGGHPRG